MGFLFRVFLMAVGIYYLFKLLTGNKTKNPNPANNKFERDPNSPSRHTDKTVHQEGEYVDYEEVD